MSLFVCVVAFIVVIDDHSDARTEFRESIGSKKFWKGIKVFAIWGVAFGSLVATLVLGWESFRDDEKQTERDNQYSRVANQLTQATNALFIISNRAANAESKAENIEQRTKWRQITPKQMEDFKKLTAMIKKIPVRVSIGQECGDVESFSRQLRDMLNNAGFKDTNTQEELLGVHHDHTRIEALPIGGTNMFEDAQIIFAGEDIPKPFGVISCEFVPSQTPPIVFKVPETATNKDVFDALDAAFRLIGVRVAWNRADRWVAPGEFELFVPCNR